jgi:hypothetical protein
MVPAVLVAQQGLQNVARDLWTPKRAGTKQLGGELSPNQLTGYLCRTCSDAVDHVHAMGPTALERALVTSIAPSGVGKLDFGNFSMPGLIGFGAVVAEAHRRGESPPSPGIKPWQHLGDVDALSERLSVTLG